MILVTGATGTVGRQVLRLLQEGGHAARAMTRGPAPGAEFVRADFTDPVSLRRAVSGVRAVFLVTVPEVPSADHDLALLEAARTAGVRSVVKLSAIGSGELFAGQVVGAWHRDAEDAVRASGLEWTVLRPSSFASNWLHRAGEVRAGRPVPDMTGQGRQGVVDPRDVAAVAVAALTGPGHAGRTWTLTGPEPLRAADQADRLARVIGRPVETVDVPEAAAREQMSASGMPAAAVDAILLGSAWARAGHNAVVTGDVAAVLGRPPASFDDWARRHRAAFIDSQEPQVMVSLT
jgi:uncharacterized protein YbjT (DUF2867 family)